MKLASKLLFVFSSPLCKEQASLLCRADPLRPVGHRDPWQLAHLLCGLTVRGRHGRDQGRVLEALRRDPVQGHQARRQWQLRESPAAAGRQGLSCCLDSCANRGLLFFSLNFFYSLGSNSEGTLIFDELSSHDISCFALESTENSPKLASYFLLHSTSTTLSRLSRRLY